MTKEEFAQSIKAKYPQYANEDDTALADKVLAKYPVYQSKIDQKSIARKVGDFFTSSSQAFGETLGTAASVVDKEVGENREAVMTLAREQSDNFIRLAQEEPDKEKKTKLLKAAEKASETAEFDIFNDPEYQKTAKQIIGEGLGTGLEIASFGTYGSASKVPTIAKALTPAKTVLGGLKTGAKVGATFGAGFGVSEALQEDKSLKDVAKAGLTGGTIGGVGGAVLGGGISSLGVGVSKATARASKLVALSEESIGKAAYKKLNSVSRDLMKMSPTATRNEAKWNKNTPKFLVDEGIISLVESDGKKINTKEAVSALKEKYFAEAGAFSNLLKDSGEYVSLNKLRDKVIKNTSDDLKFKGSDYDKAIKHIDNEIASYKSNLKDRGVVQGDDLLVNISDFNKIKSGLWSRTSNFNPTQQDKLLSDLNYQMGQASKELIEETLTDTGVKSMNSRMGNFITAIKVLESAEGKTLPGGFFGRQFTKLAGTVAGSGGGVPGSVIGNLTGGALADLAMNPKIKTSILTKVYNKLGKTEKGQSIIDEASTILKKRGEERKARLLLEESKVIIVEPKTDTSGIIKEPRPGQQILETDFPRIEAPKAIPLGAKAPGESSVKGVLAKPGLPGRDVETGRFKKVFTSEGFTKEEEQILIDSLKK